MFASRRNSPSRAVAGFTLVEVLAAMLFLAIVIPVVVEGITVSGRAAVASERRREAAQLADRVLTEAIVTGQWRTGDQTGNFEPDRRDYQWALTSSDWDQDVMRLVTVEVTYTVQGVGMSVQLSTLDSETAS